MSDEFTPYPKNPLIANFFTVMGRSDTIGSGVKNLYKYTPIYSGGGNPELYEADVFRIAIPLTKDAVKQIEMETELTEREQLIYDMINENQKISVDDIAAKLDVTRRIVLRDVQEIKKKAHFNIMKHHFTTFFAKKNNVQDTLVYNEFAKIHYKGK